MKQLAAFFGFVAALGGLGYWIAEKVAAPSESSATVVKIRDEKDRKDAQNDPSTMTYAMAKVMERKEALPPAVVAATDPSGQHAQTRKEPDRDLEPWEMRAAELEEKLATDRSLGELKTILLARQARGPGAEDAMQKAAQAAEELKKNPEIAATTVQRGVTALQGPEFARERHQLIGMLAEMPEKADEARRLAAAELVVPVPSNVGADLTTHVMNYSMVANLSKGAEELLPTTVDAIMNQPNANLRRSYAEQMVMRYPASAPTLRGALSAKGVDMDIKAPDLRLEVTSNTR